MKKFLLFALVAALAFAAAADSLTIESGAVASPNMSQAAPVVDDSGMGAALYAKAGAFVELLPGLGILPGIEAAYSLDEATLGAAVSLGLEARSGRLTYGIATGAHLTDFRPFDEIRLYAIYHAEW